MNHFVFIDSTIQMRRTNLFKEFPNQTPEKNDRYLYSSIYVLKN